MIVSAKLLVLGFAVLGSAAQVDMAGRWKGGWTLPGGESRDLVLSIEPAGEGRWAGSIVSLAGGIEPQPLPSLSIDSDVVRFEPTVGDERIRFRGKRSDDGRSISGIVTAPTHATPGVFHLDHRPMVRSLPHHIVYGVDIPVTVDALVPLTVHLQRQADGWLGEVDFPESGVLGYPVEVQGSNGVLMLSLPSPAGGDPVSLTMQPGEPMVTGLWGRGQRVQVVELQRDRDTPVRRPQVPTKPYSWQERAVQVESDGSPTLRGVLASPATAGPFPLAVLLGEAGTDHNGTIEAHPVLLVLTKALTDAGIATLRLDTEGADFVTRRRALRRWMEWVAEQPNIDTRYVALIGHGEGGSIAARHTAAFDEGVTALVLLSAPGLPGRMIESARLRDLLKQVGVTNEAIDGVIAAHDAYLDLAIKGVHADAIAEYARAWLAAQRMALGLTGPPNARDVQAAAARADDATWRYWLSYDPRATMPRISGVPVLAMQGSRDETLDAAANLTALVDASRPSGVNIEPRMLPSLNHLLQPVGQRDDVSPMQIRTTMAPSAMQTLLDWVTPQLVREDAGRAAP